MLLLVGVEVSPRGGHFLAFGLERAIDHAGLFEADIGRAVDRAAALGFAAHPFSEGSRMSRMIGRPHPWGALATEDYTGIEVWSLLTEAAESWRSPREALASRGSRMSKAIGRPHPWSALEDCERCGIELWSLVTDSAERWASPLETTRSGILRSDRMIPPRPRYLAITLLAVAALGLTACGKDSAKQTSTAAQGAAQNVEQRARELARQTRQLQLDVARAAPGLVGSSSSRRRAVDQLRGQQDQARRLAARVRSELPSDQPSRSTLENANLATARAAEGLRQFGSGQSRQPLARASRELAVAQRNLGQAADALGRNASPQVKRELDQLRSSLPKLPTR